LRHPGFSFERFDDMVGPGDPTECVLEIPQRCLTVEVGSGMVHRVLDENGPEFAKECVPCGAFHADIGSDAGKQQIADISRPQVRFQIGRAEAAVA
jgi:hypothetical protein